MNNELAVITSFISSTAAVISVTCLLIVTLYQLPRKIVDTFKVEIFRMFYSEPTASIFQWYRKTSNCGTSIRFSDIKGFFPAYLRTRYCESFFAVAIAEVKLNLEETEYLKLISYNKALNVDRNKVFQFLEYHKREFRLAMRGENFHSVRYSVSTHYEKLCNALDNITYQEDED